MTTNVRTLSIVRRLAACALLIGVCLGWSGLAAAQDEPAGTPTELHITISDTGYDLSSASIPAGQVRLTVESRASDTRRPADADLLLPPDDTSVDTALSDIAAINAAALGTPTAEEASPETGSGLPAWIYQASWAGGPSVPAGETVETTVTLTAGTWVVFNGSFGSPQQPTTLEVTGEAAEAPAPDSAATITFAEYAFGGLDAGLPAGEQTWEITNVGAQPHFMVLAKGPSGITLDEVLELLQSGGPSPEGQYQESDFDFNQPGLGLLSNGQTAYLTLDLEPGTYIALCLVPDVESGMPHAMLGMAQVFEVGGGEAGTPAT